jgi:DUF1680 family protein
VNCYWLVLAGMVGIFCMSAQADLAGGVKDKIADVYEPGKLGDVKIGGMLGERMRVNLEGRLLKVDEGAILGGYQKRPGTHPWIGEHVGKFLHAGVNTWLYSKDARLKEKIDRVAQELMKCQMEDGYLGTYTADKRWTSWDVWSHKYNLIGLLAYYDATGDEQALKVCRGMGDLLCRTFGDGDQKTIEGKDIGKAGEHLGMAATSILEPMCNLYRHTGEKKYLDFCFYITRAMEKNAHVISSLTETKKVYGTANNKAYEMLSNLVGLVELYRVTGEEKFLVPAVNGWEDIVAHRLYVTGTTSSHEFFQPDGHLPGGESDDVGEGCVTVTWMQLNLSLLRLKGEAKFADQLERTIYNQLLAAQEKGSGDICYFTPLMGAKKPTHEINCCLSSEPRGISMIPLAAVGSMKGGVVVNLYEPMGGKVGDVEVKLQGNEKIALALKAPVERKYPLFLRVPEWAGDVGIPATKMEAGYRRIEAAGGENEVSLTVPRKVKKLDGGSSYPGCVAVQRGPQVLCVDMAKEKSIPLPDLIAVADDGEISQKVITTGMSAVYLVVDPETRQFQQQKKYLMMMPFADAQAPRVWLRAANELPKGPAPVTFGGKESQSRPGNMANEGPINDLRVDTVRSTRNNQFADEDWFAVEMEKPAMVARVVYRHGTARPDGGWWDTSGGKPRVEYKLSKDGVWKKFGELSSYPSTNASEDPKLQSGQAFEVKVDQPVWAVAIRVVGKPASGARPKRSFVTCAELEGYEK